MIVVVYEGVSVVDAVGFRLVSVAVGLGLVSDGAATGLSSSATVGG
jgi:hypothetical protein